MIDCVNGYVVETMGCSGHYAQHVQLKITGKVKGQLACPR